MSIKDYKNWLVWKEKHRPVSALTGKQAGWNRNLATYAEAEQFCLDNEGYRMGLCFSEDLPYVGLDLDACIGSEGIEDWAKEVILTLVDSMIIDNRSVSGTGIKVVLKCSEKVKRGVRFIEAAQHGDHKPQIELFSDNKYFALTSPFMITEVDALEVDLKVLSEVMGYDVSATEALESSNSTAGDTTPEELREMFSKIDVMEYSTRAKWLQMMSAAHHASGGSDEGKEVFKEWSMGDEASYSETDLERDWGSLKTNVSNPVTVATIIHALPKKERKKVMPEEDFDIVETPATTNRLLGWLLNCNCLNHAKVTEQLSLDKEGDVIRFVPEWNSWIIYDGTRWVRDDKGSQVHQHVMEYIKSLGSRIPDGDGESVAKALAWISSLQNYNSTIGVAKQARGERGLKIGLSEMNTDKHLLNFKNGTYDLDKDEFRGHDPKDYIFHRTETNYVEGQQAPLWDKVVNDIFAGDVELISYVRRVLGLSVSGDCSDPIFNVFYGDGANGKSTIVGTVGDMLGEYSCHLPSEMFDKNRDLHPTYTASLYGARLAVVAEMESDVSLSEATVKKLTSMDKIEARKMRQDPWHFTPTHTSILCTNHLPQIKGSDLGVWRRIKLVPFEVNLTAVKDVTIPERLKAEYSGIANWLIEGYREYKAMGEVGSCEAVDTATEEYRNDEDEFARVFEDLFEKCEGAIVTVVDAHQSYVSSGGRLGRKKFCSEMARMGYENRRVSVSGSRPRGFVGIKLSFKEFGG